ncbi:hypothetical protein RIF29_20622 [Crotalaria pallida]|uniref:Uncharacterized protein n=1 Tax=Crotalaria pallida TaxID=3830 RepID=A0AAN9ICL8_CROPI
MATLGAQCFGNRLIELFNVYVCDNKKKTSLPLCLTTLYLSLTLNPFSLFSLSTLSLFLTLSLPHSLIISSPHRHQHTAANRAATTTRSLLLSLSPIITPPEIAAATTITRSAHHFALPLYLINLYHVSLFWIWVF